MKVFNFKYTPIFYQEFLLSSILWRVVGEMCLIVGQFTAVLSVHCQPVLLLPRLEELHGHIGPEVGLHTKSVSGEQQDLLLKTTHRLNEKLPGNKFCFESGGRDWCPSPRPPPG